MAKRPLRKYFNLLSIFVILSFIVTSGFGCKLQSQAVKEKTKPITINYWRVWDDADAFDPIITDYQALHPNININYRKFRYEEYEQELLNAWAEDRGPDIFSIPESWLMEYQSKIQPMPTEISMAYQHISGGLQKEVTYEVKTVPTITLRQLKDNYPDIVASNMVINNQIYGLPLSLETLVMFYNKDILNNAGIAQVPTTWNQFQDDVQKMARFGTDSKIIQAGTALGTGNNIDRCFDILSVLMMQNGATMADANGNPTFFGGNRDSSKTPGNDALVFYTDFAMPLKSVYSWSSDMPNSLDAFMAGQVGIIFGYNFNLATIKAQAPRLSLGVAPIPQVNSAMPRNYANYWIETVSKKSKNQNEAWDFILFMSQKQELSKYLAVAQRPAPLKSLISSQAENEFLHAASTQTLTADNWYRGKDALAAESAFKDMVNQYVNVATDEERNAIMRNAVYKIAQTMK